MIAASAHMGRRIDKFQTKKRGFGAFFACFLEVLISFGEAL